VLLAAPFLSLCSAAPSNNAEHLKMLRAASTQGDGELHDGIDLTHDPSTVVGSSLLPLEDDSEATATTHRHQHVMVDMLSAAGGKRFFFYIEALIMIYSEHVQDTMKFL
jgi:hypothetical protein